MYRSITIALCLVSLGACGESKPPVKTVFDAPVQALDKARQVERKVEDAARQQQEQVERATEK